MFKFALAALMLMTLPAHAQNAASEAEKRKAVLPYIRAATSCVANAVRQSEAALNYARRQDWLGALSHSGWVDRCNKELGDLIEWHDHYYGTGGWEFVKGPYVGDLPRAIEKRIKPELEAIAANETRKNQQWENDVAKFMSDYDHIFRRNEALILAFDGIVRQVTSDENNKYLSNREILEKSIVILSRRIDLEKNNTPSLEPDESLFKLIAEAGVKLNKCLRKAGEMLSILTTESAEIVYEVAISKCKAEKENVILNAMAVLRVDREGANEVYEKTHAAFDRASTMDAIVSARAAKTLNNIHETPQPPSSSPLPPREDGEGLRPAARPY